MSSISDTMSIDLSAKTVGLTGGQWRIYFPIGQREEKSLEAFIKRETFSGEAGISFLRAKLKSVPKVGGKLEGVVLSKISDFGKGNYTNSILMNPFGPYLISKMDKSETGDLFIIAEGIDYIFVKETLS